MARNKLVNSTKTDLTDYEIGVMYITSVQAFVEVASKAGIEQEQVFTSGKKLFDNAIASIVETRKKLS